MASLTPELLAQLEKDVASWWSPEQPYRLGIEGERDIDGQGEDTDEMTIYGVMDDGASHEIATFHVDNMANCAVRLFGAAPALVEEVYDLRREVADFSEMLRESQLDRVDLAEERDQLCAERDQLRSEVARLRAIREEEDK